MVKHIRTWLNIHIIISTAFHNPNVQPITDKIIKTPIRSLMQSVYILFSNLYIIININLISSMFFSLILETGGATLWNSSRCQLQEHVCSLALLLIIKTHLIVFFLLYLYYNKVFLLHFYSLCLS